MWFIFNRKKIINGKFRTLFLSLCVCMCGVSAHVHTCVSPKLMSGVFLDHCPPFIYTEAPRAICYSHSSSPTFQGDLLSPFWMLGITGSHCACLLFTRVFGANCAPHDGTVKRFILESSLGYPWVPSPAICFLRQDLSRRLGVHWWRLGWLTSQSPSSSAAQALGM